MKKPKNEPIGSVTCPMRGCEETADVFKYRKRSEEEGRSRFAGKWYSVCPKGHRCEQSDYMLENAKIWGDKKPAAPVAAPEAGEKKEATKPAPVKTPKKQASAPVAKNRESTGKLGSELKGQTNTPSASVPTAKKWGFF